MSRRKDKPGYEERLAAHKAQKYPAKKSRPVHKGPSKRPPGFDRRQWVELMEKKLTLADFGYEDGKRGKKK